MARRHTQTFDGYWRGILQRRTPRSQEAGWVDEALNVVFRGGAIQSRPGLRPFSGVPFSGNVRGYCFHVRVDGTREALVAAGAAFQRCTFGGDPIDIPLTGLPLYNQTRVEREKVFFLSLSGGTNTTFIYDGVNPNVKWDGSVLSKMGLPDGPTPVVPADAAGLISKGTRRYVETLVSPYHEGEISAVFREVTLATDNHSLTFASPTQTPDAVGSPATIAAAAAANQYDDPQVTKWRLWRTVGTVDNTGAQLRFIGEADIGTDIVDNVTDEVLGGNDVVERLVNKAPQAPIIAMVEHRGQLIAAMADDASILRFSNVDPDYMVPEGWPRNFVQPVSHGDGDLVTSLRSFNEWAVVFKSNSTHAIIGDAFKDYKIVPVLAGGTRQGIGCGFPGSILQIENAVFFASRDGFYRIDRGGNLTAVRISSAIDDLYSAVNFSLGSATFFDRKKRVFWFGGHG